MAAVWEPYRETMGANSLEMGVRAQKVEQRGSSLSCGKNAMSPVTRPKHHFDAWRLQSIIHGPMAEFCYRPAVPEGQVGWFRPANIIGYIVI
jgi:hypothetical protein